ncbi:hypothetical protein Micbo1qcDRAFT_54736 [Microdochium bolleyi]|uniref:2EXR domain-containing protein n=1 Tax=Microdochium bolleyi TaxID=196109 RepID=A0A136J846_9PEZI|nr:hypothetical protein Micbo1qcDRAFT_54736 [Microdochium bolleyi]
MQSLDVRGAAMNDGPVDDGDSVVKPSILGPSDPQDLVMVPNFAALGVDDLSLGTFPASSSKPLRFVHSASDPLVVHDFSMMDADDEMLSTPLMFRNLLAQPPPRPVTRSMTKDNLAVLLPGEDDSVKAKLRASVKSRVRPRLVENFEDSRSINHDGEVDMHGEPSSRPKRSKSSLRKSSANKRARRSRGSTEATWSSREPTPVDNVISKVTSGRVRKRSAATPASASRHPRRSARLAKPLTDFHMFGQLPRELQIMVWEAAIEPRVVYLRNRSRPGLFGGSFNGKVQNKQPKWFLACQTSWYVAQLHYQPMFKVIPAYSYHVEDNKHIQAMDVNSDIVLLEPCCPGCRAYSCTRHQFQGQDRERVRFIAVQVESPQLMENASPCWLTISLSWPNVETIYMTRTSVVGDDETPKALIRVSEDAHEQRLYKRFVQWKKAEGAHNKIRHIEFVAVVNREEGKFQERYHDVPGRKTGMQSDIVVG